MTVAHIARAFVELEDEADDDGGCPRLDVAELLRDLAGALDAGTITPEEVNDEGPREVAEIVYRRRLRGAA